MCYFGQMKQIQAVKFARVLVLSGAHVLQRQAEVFGASSAEDLRGPSQIQQPEERAGARQAQPHAGARQVEPRVSVK